MRVVGKAKGRVGDAQKRMEMGDRSIGIRSPVI